MNMGTSTSFAEQEAAAMEKNREAFMALWYEYVKGRKGDKAVLRYLVESGFFTSPASTKYHGAFPGGLCYHSVNVATEVLGIMAQHQLEDENLSASAVTCALLHDICKAGTYRQTTKRQRGPDGKWQDVPAYEYDDSGLPLGHGEKSLFLAKLDMNNFGPLRGYFRAAQKYIGKTKKQIIDACGQAADHCFRWGSSQWLLPTRETYLDIVAKFELDSWEGYRDFDSLLEEQARLVKQYDEQIQAADNARFVHNLDANHCNVWLSNEPTGRHSIHPTQKPVDLLERAIRTHTKPGAVVCDFFAGSGSTGVAAIKAGRRYILIEQSASYYEKGLAWLEETKSALCT